MQRGNNNYTSVSMASARHFRDRRRFGPIVTPALILIFWLLTLGNYTPKGIRQENNNNNNICSAVMSHNFRGAEEMRAAGCLIISQLTNLCTGIRSWPPPISRHPFRCSFGCVLLFNRMF